MKRIQLYQVDTFTDKLFSGSAAAVCPLDRWLSDELLKSIAAENLLPETVFFVERVIHPQTTLISNGLRRKWNLTYVVMVP